MNSFVDIDLVRQVDTQPIKNRFGAGQSPLVAIVAAFQKGTSAFISFRSLSSNQNSNSGG